MADAMIEAPAPTGCGGRAQGGDSDNAFRRSRGPASGATAAALFRTFFETVRQELRQAFDNQWRTMARWFEDVGENPERLLRSTLRALIETLRNLIQLALGVSGGVIGLLLDLAKTFFRAIQNILRTRVDSALLQARYNLVNPSPEKVVLTLGDLLFLMMATPVSIGAFVLTGRGFLAPIGGPEGETLALFSPDALGSDRVSRFAAGLVRIMPWSFLDMGLTLGWEAGVREKFCMYMIPCALRFLRLPPNFADWSTPNLLQNAHWVVASLAPFSRLPAVFAPKPLSEGASMVTALLATAAVGMALGRIIDALERRQFDALSGFIWVVGPVSSIVSH